MSRRLLFMRSLLSSRAFALLVGSVVSAPGVAFAQVHEVEITTANPTPVEVTAPSSASPTASSAPATSNAPLAASSAVPPSVVANAAQPEVIDPEVVRRACHDAERVDWIGWTFAGVYVATGVSVTLYGAFYSDPPMMPVPVGIAYMRGIGPGLILGAIGAPLARGVFATNDPLQSVCARMRQNGREHRDNALDTYAADRVLRSIGAPPSFVMPLLVGLATLGCAVLTAIPFIIQDPGIAGPAGGISAAAVAAWVVLPPTPMQSASRAYVRGEYAVHAHVARTGTVGVAPLGFAPGLTLVGTF
jgi:hypothetical protein